MRPQARSSSAKAPRSRGVSRVGERDPVGVDVLAQQRDLEHALVDQRLHLGQDVAGPAVDLLAAQRGHDAERAGVVASDGDGNPSGVGGFARRGQRRRELLAAPRRFRPGRPGCAGPGRAASAANRCCGCRTRRRPTAPCAAPSSRSFCARQPPTAICMSGSACLRGARWLRLPYSLLSAFSRTAQVLKTTTSASAPSAARGSRRLPADRPAARNRARSSGSRRCGPDRCARRDRRTARRTSPARVTIEVTAPWYGADRAAIRRGFASSRQAGRSLGKVCTHGTVDAGRSDRGVPMISMKAVNKHFGDLHVLKDIDLDVARGPGDRRARAVGLGQVDAVPHHQSARDHRLRHHRDRR